MKTLSTKPVRGTSDWKPEEFKIRNYIFQTWRNACESFGYQEYLTPLIEDAEIYRAKSGNELGGKQLLIFTNTKGEDLALRPEMTPSVTRMLSSYYNAIPKPVRLFSIANFWRNEKPQKGRNREFWQLNVDIFGEDSVFADIEILMVGINIMLEFGATAKMFSVRINNRNLIDFFIKNILKIDDEKVRKNVFNLLDKWTKLNNSDLENIMRKELKFSNQQIETLKTFASLQNEQDFLNEFPEIADSNGFQNIKTVLEQLRNLGLEEYVEFIPSIVRGIDYYDGLVFEAFDKNPENTRALWGGGRYNGLANIFGIKDMPAVGFGWGDETMKLFLQGWNLLPEFTDDVYFIPVLEDNLRADCYKLAESLRKGNLRVIVSVETFKSIGKALKFADRNKYAKVIIYGDEEKNAGKYIIKDMESGEQRERDFRV